MKIKMIHSKVAQVRSLLMVLLVLSGLVTITACPPPPPPGKTPVVLKPNAQGVQRGATTVDLYGKWTREAGTLGRQNFRWRYQVSYVKTGTVVYSNGTTSGPPLTPLDAAKVSWTLKNGRATQSAPDAQTDTNGNASVTLTAKRSTGPETLTVAVTYSNGAFSDTSDFEVAPRSKTVPK